LALIVAWIADAPGGPERSIKLSGLAGPLEMNALRQPPVIASGLEAGGLVRLR